MNGIGIEEKQKSIFTKLFLTSNKLQAVGDRIFTDEMTIRQWLLTAAIAQYGDTHPTLSEVAEVMGNTRQNVKQLALKLEKGGFLVIEKDRQDMRITRLGLTEKSCIYWQQWYERMEQYLAGLFKDFSKDDINSLYECLNQLYENILKIESSLKSFGGVIK